MTPGLRATTPLVMVVVLSFSRSACGHGAATTPTAPTPVQTAPTVTSVTVTGSANFPAPGQSSQLVAAASFSDAAAQNVTTLAAWQSSNLAVATVSGAGLLATVSFGAVATSVNPAAR